MQLLRISLLALAISAALPAQDQVVLKDGNTLTGTIKAMAGGKMTFHVADLGDVTVPMANVVNLKSSAPVTLLTKEGERVSRAITGIENGQVMLGAGGDGAFSAPSIGLDQLGAMNPPPSDHGKWTGSVNIGGFLSDGNTERRAVAASGQAVRRGEQDRLTADMTWNYAEDREPGRWVLNDRRLTGGLKYDYFLSKRLYIWADTRATGDTIADIKLRFSAGGGVGYQIYEQDDLKWGVEVGLAYVDESYRSNAPDKSYMAARVASILEWVISDSVKLLNTTSAFPSLEDSADFYLLKSTRLQVKMSDSMFAQLGWELEYDNTPSPGRQRLDNRYTLSVGWSF